MKTTLIFLLAMGTGLCFAQDAVIELNFENQFKDQKLAFKNEYTNAHGEKFTVTLLNYYISNIQFLRKDGSSYRVPQDSSYFLVRQNEPSSSRILLRVPSGAYTSMSFVIGVDSLRSTMGAKDRQGVLDVGATARGMYWQWNSGYIFFKMEGKSSSSPDSLKNNFYYHIGGYGGYDSPTLNNIRVKKFDFAKPLKAGVKKQTIVDVVVDVSRFFDSKNPIKIGAYPSIMWGPVSTLIADNYVDIFGVHRVSYTKGGKR